MDISGLLYKVKPSIFSTSTLLDGFAHTEHPREATWGPHAQASELDFLPFPHSICQIGHHVLPLLSP